eukprot:GHUV01043858.1.p1 GENE.GHUV01043858.1~~GHUV01043858.1.p1  ORF type:complete len:116 (-),score=14.62 GHUV01043858.1:1188-1535(-)
MLSSNCQLPCYRPHIWSGTPFTASKPHNSCLRRCLRVRSYTAEADPVVTTAWLAEHLNEVTILDVRGHVDTVLISEGVEKSTYFADYDQYLEGHVPVSSSSWLSCTAAVTQYRLC